MQSKKINPVVSWWMTPKLPYQDIYELPLLKNKSVFAKYSHIFSSWVVHPIKRRLAKYYLDYLKKNTGIVVVGVTGSAGKSTTTGILSQILSEKFEVMVTPPGIDPVFNIPNTILRCTKNTKYLILEMSVEFSGEMDYYLWLAQPDCAVITNIHATHLEFFKDEDGVLSEKGKLANSLNKNGVAFLNSADKRLKDFAKDLNCKVIWFIGDGHPIEDNWEAAKSVAKYFNFSDKALEKVHSQLKIPEHRMNIKKSGDITILDDTYNSNPSAAVSVIKYFAKISKGFRVVVLGDMLQMGDYNKQAHEIVGIEAAKYNFDFVIGVGKSSEIITRTVSKKSNKTKVIWTKNVDEAIGEVKKILKPNAYVLVKGSRSIGLDKLVDSLS